MQPLHHPKQNITVKFLGKDSTGQIVAVTLTEVTVGQIYDAEVTGINGYVGSLESTVLLMFRFGLRMRRRVSFLHYRMRP